MQTETPWRVNKKVFDILFGWNFPLLIWIVFAGVRFLLHYDGTQVCPTRAVFGFCPGCGLTRHMVRLFRGEVVTDWWFWLIFSGFVLNFLFSLLKAYKILAKER